MPGYGVLTRLDMSTGRPRNTTMNLWTAMAHRDTFAYVDGGAGQSPAERARGSPPPSFQAERPAGNRSACVTVTLAETWHARRLRPREPAGSAAASATGLLEPVELPWEEPGACVPGQR